jgi:chain length determinant protein EpsF
MMGLAQVLRILRGRAALFVTILIGVVGAVAVVSLLAPKKYVAELALVADIKGDDSITNGALAPSLVPTYLATQMEIIRSRNVALKVIDKMHLPNTEESVDELLRSLDAKTTRNSNIIRISYESTDPEIAAAVANAFAAAYVETSLELQVDPARRRASWFEQQVQQLRDELVAAQQRLAKYQSDHGVLGVDDARLDVENARMQEISNHLVTVQAAMVDADTRRAQVAKSDQLDSMPDLQKSPLLQNLKSDLARAEAKLADLGERYDLNHPQYRSALAEVTALRNKVNSEIGVVRGSLVQNAAIAKRQVEETQAQLEEQKDRIIALKRQRDELTVLNRDVESAKQAYDAALQQTNQTRLESRVDRTNVAVLNPATPPVNPSSPRVLLNLVVALFAGTALATGLILMLEVCSRRVRSATDFMIFDDLPVLAELPPLSSATLRRKQRLPNPSRRAIKLQTRTA